MGEDLTDHSLGLTWGGRSRICMGGTTSQIGEGRIVNQRPLLLQGRETARLPELPARIIRSICSGA
jgi:hypothetical protein